LLTRTTQTDRNKKTYSCSRVGIQVQQFPLMMPID